MTNTSADWPSYLTPASSPSAPDEDAALDADLAAIVVGICGFSDPNLVRPRWQPNPPNEPAADVDWCAIGVLSEETSTTADFVHVGTGDGHDNFARQEKISVVATFYGPNAKGNAKTLRDGVVVPQNRDMMKRVGLNMFDSSGPITTADLINTTWRRRADLSLRFVRMVNRVYNVENIVSGSGTIRTDIGADATTPGPSEPFSVTTG